MLHRNTIVRLYSASPALVQTKKCALHICGWRMPVERENLLFS
jgi:hypothetical protein